MLIKKLANVHRAIITGAQKIKVKASIPECSNKTNNNARAMLISKTVINVYRGTLYNIFFEIF